MGKDRDKFRDPVHGFIEVSALERELIDSEPFQRLRNIKQLAMTYLVFHGAEHTRFGHSIGVMHMVTRAFESAVKNGKPDWTEVKIAFYRQLLRLIALTHDLGHAPFSHAAESVFPVGMEHEDFTRKIVLETEIRDIIDKIGDAFQKEYGSEYQITPELICDIYQGKNPGPNMEYIFLKSFMDSEMDCDKMDYLLRDALYCGVNYGKYDVERLISCLTVYQNDGFPRLAIRSGGVQAFEEFMLARYFMFVQVYFHRTRRFFDKMYFLALKEVLPGGTFPVDTREYLLWDDYRVWNLLREHVGTSGACDNIVHRKVYPRVFETKTHPSEADFRNFRIMRKIIYDKFGKDCFIEDCSADKMPHKIPIRTTPDDERAIIIIDETEGKISTISEESIIIKSLTEKINIQRIYLCDRSIFDEVTRHVQEYVCFD